MHSAEKNNPVNCFSRGGGCERSERSLEVAKTKVSANVVKRTTCFCEANPRQFRVTFVVILNLFQDLIIRKGVLNIVETDSSVFSRPQNDVKICHYTDDFSAE